MKTVYQIVRLRTHNSEYYGLEGTWGLIQIRAPPPIPPISPVIKTVFFYDLGVNDRHNRKCHDDFYILEAVKFTERLL